MSSAVETLESTATDVLGSLADGSLLSGLFSRGEAVLPAPADRGEDPGSSPFKLLLPAGSDSFSLMGGEIGSGGAPLLLLLCVLTSGLVLLRREGKLLWASRELPKPSSALCPALERPG